MCPPHLQVQWVTHKLLGEAQRYIGTMLTALGIYPLDVAA
jgi:hypothetical protein